MCRIRTPKPTLYWWKKSKTFATGEVCHIRGLGDWCREHFKFSPISSLDSVQYQSNTSHSFWPVPFHSVKTMKSKKRETVAGWRRPRRHAAAWSALQHKGRWCSGGDLRVGSVFRSVAVYRGAFLGFDRCAVVMLMSRETSVLVMQTFWTSL